MPTPVKRKVFFSYYQGDVDQVREFIGSRDHLFIPRILGVNDYDDDLIDSTDPAYVMTQIRSRYITTEATVTIVLIGSCTHSRRYVDWEIKSSLRQGSYTPNGLIAILLDPKATSGVLPERFKENWTAGHKDCYARFWQYPSSDEQLRGWIEDAVEARTSRAHLINNSRDMWKYSRKCELHEVTH